MLRSSKHPVARLPHLILPEGSGLFLRDKMGPENSSDKWGEMGHLITAETV